MKDTTKGSQKDAGASVDLFLPEDTTAIYLTFGKITAGWSLLEFAMDAVAIVIYHEIGGRRIEPELPIQTDRKVRFLRRCFKKIHVLGPYSNHALSLLERLTPLIETRNDIVHGYLSAFDRQSTRITLIRIKLNKEKTLHSEVRIVKALPELIQVGLKIHDIAHEFATLTQRLMDQFMTDARIKSPVSKF